VREDSGLAMSSRNKRLSAQGMQIAASIYATIQVCKILCSYYSPKEVLEIGRKLIKAEESLELEYLAIINEDDWSFPEALEIGKNYRIVIAVWCEGIRLIDNIAV